MNPTTWSSMRVERRGLSALVLTTLLASVVWAQPAHAGFRPSDWNFVGHALRTDDGKAQLTADVGGQTGGVWTRGRKNVVKPWKVTFKFQMLHAFKDGADGFAFVVQDVGSTTLGESGAGLGYGGIDDSFAVEFDTYANTGPYSDLNTSGRDDPNGMHVRLMSRLNNPNTSEHDKADKGGLTPNQPPTLNDRAVHTAKIAYNRKHLKVSVDGVLVLDVAIASLSQWIGDIPNDGKAHLGFTATTGGFWQSHVISGFRFERL